MAPAVQFLSVRVAAVSARVERRPLLEPGGEDEHPGVPQAGGGWVPGPARQQGFSIPRE